MAPVMNSVDTADLLRRGAADAFAGTPVVFAFLFGSHATGRARADSDVDVAVYLHEALADPSDMLPMSLDLAGRLAAASGLPRIEVVVLNDAPLGLLGSILRERNVVYSADEAARVRFESTMRSMAMDFEIHSRRLDRELLARTAEGRR